MDNAAQTELTLAEVGKHSSRQSLFIVLHDKIYDVTKFASEHPGGDEVLLKYAGQDATDEFENIGHSQDARAMMDELCIGRLPQEECRHPAQDAFVDAYDRSWLKWLVPVVFGLAFGVLYRNFIQ